MKSKGSKLFKSSAGDRHEFNEEMQWARILSASIPSHGMLLIFVQKLCAAFHEFAPLAEEGALREESSAFVRKRLAARIGKVLAVADDNGLGGLPGVSSLRRLERETLCGEGPLDLPSLSERVHRINHRVVNGLLKASPRRKAKRP